MRLCLDPSHLPWDPQYPHHCPLPPVKSGAGAGTQHAGSTSPLDVGETLSGKAGSLSSWDLVYRLSKDSREFYWRQVEVWQRLAKGEGEARSTPLRWADQGEALIQGVGEVPPGAVTGSAQRRSVSAVDPAHS